MRPRLVRMRDVEGAGYPSEQNCVVYSEIESYLTIHDQLIHSCEKDIGTKP